MGNPGTISFSAETFLSVLKDICASLAQSGFKKILFVNGHGGNKWENLESKAPDQGQKLSELGIKYVTYREACPPSLWEQHLDMVTGAGHAGEFETSFAMVAFPQRIRPDQVNYESALRATIPKGGNILHTVVESVAGEVQQMLDE